MAFALDRTGAHKYLRTTGTPPNWYLNNTFTVSLWFNVADTTNVHTLLRIEHVGENQRFMLQARGDLPGDPVRFVSQAGGEMYTVDSSGAYSANTWHYAQAIANKGSGHISVVLGTNWNHAGSVKFPTGAPNFLQVGGDNVLVPAPIGRIAEVGLWMWHVSFDGAYGGLLGAHALAKGFSPLKAQPKALIGYWPLAGGLAGGGQSVVGGAALTPYNGPTIGAHCKVLL